MGGKVYALNAKDGGYIWSYATGSEIDSSPTLAAGLVYVGSHDGKVYALDAMTGAYIWSYSTGEMVVSSPAIANNIVYIGSYNHILYAFGSSSTNKLILCHSQLQACPLMPCGR